MTQFSLRLGQSTCSGVLTEKSMTMFLACLKDFTEPLENVSNYLTRLRIDKVENYSITQSFNKQESWTKALKYTLCNLKWALYWFVGNTNFQPLSAMVSSHAEVSAVGSQN